MQNDPILESSFTYKGYKCCVLFMPIGHRCGYVLVPHWHSQYGKNYRDIPIKCHGGLTYSSHFLMGQEFPSWWIGFDCAHAGDIADKESQIKYYGENEQNPFFSMLTFMLEGYDEFGTIKTLDFCEQECRNIVDQLIEMENRE